MLSAFTARAIIELKQRDKSKIESVLAYGDRLLVGLSTGSLRIYRVNEVFNVSNGEIAADDKDAPESTPKAVDLLRVEEKFSKYKIEHLAIIKEANILVALSNSYVSIHDLQSYELQETLTKTKGASAFTVTSNIVKDPSTGIPSIVSRLAVAVKRRLLLWSWHDSELSPETTELTLVTSIKTLTWATGTRLIAGLSSSYVLVDVETSAITDVVGPGSIGGAPGQDGGRFGAVGVGAIGYMGMGGVAPKPLATRLNEGQLLLAKDINTLFIDDSGQSLGKRQIPWSVAPEAIGYSYPFLLALQATKGTLEVRNPETLTCLQSISLPNANQMHVAQPNVSLAHAGKGFLISSDRCIWRMDALGYDAQIDALVEKNKLDEAISLMGLLEDALLNDKDGRLREVKMLKAQGLFDMKRFRESLDLFTEVGAPPERVIRLYPDRITGNIEEVKGDVEQEPITASTTTDSTISAPENDNKSIRSVKHSKKESVGIASLKKAASVRDSDAASVHSKAPDGQQQPAELEGKDLEVATSELASFLVDARTRLQRYLNTDGSLKEPIPEKHATLNESMENSIIETSLENLLVQQKQNVEKSREQQLRDTAKLVDTTIFRAYMFVRPTMAGPLLRLPNFCDPGVVNEKLLETKRYSDLIDFFFGKHLHREALELLKKFGQGSNEEDIAPQLRGPQRTVAYLQNLSPDKIDLMLEFAEWAIKADPHLGMEIFLTDSENAETLPRTPVLDFLHHIDPELEFEYLKYIISELNDPTPDFHQRLIDIYMNRLKSPHLEAAQKTTRQDEFLDFLRTSQHYESWRVLKQLQKDDPDLYEARAIVLGNLKEHRQALDIYVFKLNNPEKAEDYCNQIYLAENTAPSSPTQSRRVSVSTAGVDVRSIYHTLLALYLSPPPPHNPQWGPALDILAKHGSRLPASSTLNLIPEVLPIQKLESYFRARMRAANSNVNESRVIVGLRKSIDAREEAKLLLGDEKTGVPGGRNRRVIITEERVCGVCHKRFGGSAIKVLPNNAVVHYGCSVR